MSDEYEVGYGKPPKHTRFKPGRSGNPKGRPKASKSIRKETAEELAERITIKEGGQRVTLSKQRLVVKALFNKAAKGDVRAINALVALATDASGATNDEPEVLGANDAAILEAFIQRHNDDGGGDGEG